MCAICGIYQYGSDEAVNQTQLRRMARSMRHRGPDEEGFFNDPGLGLGHQRLRILDLSPAGRQPMTFGDKRYWIVLNGEIYNHVELRTELERRGVRFRSRTDTEVLLRLYALEGPACVERLNGMFAFAVWDRTERTLFAARDRLGIKPFYYVADPYRFLFASEIKAFFRAGLVAPERDPDGLADYLTFQLCLGDKTLFKNVRKLLPGHTLTVHPDGAVDVRRYWQLRFDVDADHTAAYFHRALRETLDDAVRLQLRADVPVGAHLSGGLDSSTVACLAAGHADAPIHTFTGAFDEGEAFDETSYARLVAEHAGTRHHEVYPASDLFTDALPRLVYHMDEPAAGPGLLPQFAVSELASRHVKVVLGGQGGDELFGGYTRYLIAYLEECIRGGIAGTQEDDAYVVTFASILPNLPQLRGYEPLMRHFFKDGLFDPPAQRYFRLVDRSGAIRPMMSPDVERTGYDPFDAFLAIFEGGSAASYINRMTRFDLVTLLPALLHVEDRTSMAVSIESRVPLLDHRLAELAAAMPPRVKYEGGRAKHILREVARGIVPDAISDRTDKMGFPVPLNHWYRQPRVRDFVRDTLLGRSARERGLFVPRQVEAALDAEGAYGRSVWGMLNLELWAQTFLDRKALPALDEEPLHETTEHTAHAA